MEMEDMDYDEYGDWTEIEDDDDYDIDGVMFI